MNKAEFLSIFSHPRTPIKNLEHFCVAYSDFMSFSTLNPESLNFNFKDSSDSQIKGTQRETNLSCTNSVSIVSNFSRISTDRLVVNNILLNKSKFQIFSELLPDENWNSKFWYFVISNDVTFGPFSSSEMNDRFANEVFNEQTMFKCKFDDKYYSLRVIVTRYFKNVLSNKANYGFESPTKLGDKLRNFNRGNLLKSTYRNNEKYKIKQRCERFMTEKEDRIPANFKLVRRMDSNESNSENARIARERAKTENEHQLILNN